MGRYLDMTTSALRHKLGRGQVPAVRMDGKLRFDRLELDRLIDTAKRGGRMSCVRCGRELAARET